MKQCDTRCCKILKIKRRESNSLAHDLQYLCLIQHLIHDFTHLRRLVNSAKNVSYESSYMSQSSRKFSLLVEKWW